MASIKSPSAARILRFLGAAAAGPVPRWANREQATARFSKTTTQIGVRLGIVIINMVPGDAALELIGKQGGDKLALDPSPDPASSKPAVLANLEAFARQRDRRASLELSRRLQSALQCSRRSHHAT